ncbi:hypothetical protein [uncultured Brachyspira sp.]|uniref:hypothetical protein n=1 Tax=uncultured Brachyspira sp. TaxID=221953 RepID=UPI0025CEA589|nr:hypothetical protein [uncultured Brachyspira sp.]
MKMIEKLDITSYNLKTEKELKDTIMILQERIKDLNYHIGEIETENNDLREKIEKFNLKKCKYPLYIVSDLLKDMYFSELSDESILKVAQDNSLLDKEDYVIGIPIDKNSNKIAFAFSLLGVMEMIQLLQNTINDKMDNLISVFDKKPDNFDETVNNIEKELLSDEYLLQSNCIAEKK